MSCNTENICVISYNVRGIREKNKRNALWCAVKEKGFDICMLQETYITEELELVIERELGSAYICVNSRGTEHSKGVTCIVKKKNISIENMYTDHEGRLAILNIKINHDIYTVVNIYAPNTETERNLFFKNTAKLISKHGSSDRNYIVGGDFNYTPDPALDRDNRDRQSIQKQDKSHLGYQRLCKSFHLKDIWRTLNEGVRHFTCRNKSRIDFFLVSEPVFNNNLDTHILQGPIRSDHKMVSLNFKVNRHKRGPGYWKLNTSFLNENTYKLGIQQIIKNNKQQTFASSQIRWEMCKLQIKEFSIRYGKDRQNSQNYEIKQLETELEQLESNNLLQQDASIEARKSDVKEKIENYYINKAKAAQIRSRVKWIEEGEKGTKFFLGLEKTHQENNVIASLKVENKTLNDPMDILKQEVKFYSHLYTSAKVQDNEIHDYLTPIMLENILNDNEQQLCEGLLTVDECSEAVHNMKTNKSPGCDGLPSEFYKTFWSDVSDLVLNSLNEAMEKGELSTSQKHAIMSLVYKKGDRQLLQNWRPISLLNSDYKIAAFVLANRLHKVLPKLINSDQTGYVKNRYIGCNIRLIEDIIDYINEENKKGIIMFCDFEKAFDTVEINFLLQVLTKFNFGPNFIKWIKTLYTNVSSSIKNNNWISKPFSIQRGIRQGCPISALLFILVTEVMATKIRNDPSIKGIALPSEKRDEAKVSMLADDTTIFVQDEISAEKVLKVIDDFGKVAGPKLNKHKTIGMKLGILRNNNDNITNIKWTSDTIKALGIYFGHDKKLRTKLNWEDKIKTVEKSLDIWRRRKLTLLGRILIAKTFAISKLVYLASSIACPEEYIKKIQRILYNFIWKGKRDHVKRDAIIAKREEGGLKMINFRLFEKASKVMLLKRILEPGSERWKILPQQYLNTFGPKYLILHINVCEKQTLEKLKIPRLYQNVVAAWHECRHHSQNLTLNRVSEIRKQILWKNNNIRYRGKMLYYRNWINKGIIYINQVFDDKGQFKDKDLFHELKDQPNALMEIFMLKNSISSDWTNILKSEICNLNTPNRHNMFILVDNKHLIELLKVKSIKMIYNVFVQKNKKTSSANILWQNILQEKNVVWSNVYLEKLKLCKESRLIAFNYKVINNIIATPYKLYKWKILKSDVCHMCFSQGNLEHMMIKCSYFTDYYLKVKAILRQLRFHNVNLNLHTLVCGYKPNIQQYHNLNRLLEIIFFTVYKCWTILLNKRCPQNPLYILFYELKVRCESNLYNDRLYELFYTLLKELLSDSAQADLYVNV